jgi:hypothetical protein
LNYFKDGNGDFTQGTSALMEGFKLARRINERV